MKTTVITAAAALAVAAPVANAQMFGYQNLDAILTYRQASGGTDIEFNLGPVSRFTSGGSAFGVSNTKGFAPISSTFTSLTSNTSLFPTGTGELEVNIFAGDNSAFGATAKTLFEVKTRGGGLGTISGPGTETAWQRRNSGTQGNTTTLINSVGTGANGVNQSAAGQGPGYSTLGSSLASSYTTYFGPNHNWGGKFQGNPETTLSTTNNTYMDFFKMVPSGSNSGASVYLGFFCVTPSSQVLFVPAGATSVPEPKSYAALAGAALVGFGLWRRRATR